MNVSYDDRGWGAYDILPVPTGQINYGYTYEGVIRAFHKHSHQTDNWVCVKGVIRAITVRELSDGGIERNTVYLREGDGQTLVIQPKVWHGYQPIGGDAAIVYYVTNKYDPKNPDEDRIAYDAFGDLWRIRFQ